MDTERWIQQQVHPLEERWAQDERWAGISRPYGAEEVVRLRGSVVSEWTLAGLGAERLWRLLTSGGYVNALGAMTGGQAQLGRASVHGRLRGRVLAHVGQRRGGAAQRPRRRRAAHDLARHGREELPPAR